MEKRSLIEGLDHNKQLFDVTNNPTRAAKVPGFPGLARLFDVASKDFGDGKKYFQILQVYKPLLRLDLRLHFS